jgi:hypothetical protein
MTKQSLIVAISISLGLGIIAFFIPDFKVWAYGLLALGFGGLMYVGHVFGDKNQRPMVMVGALILLLMALYKFFNSLM